MPPPELVKPNFNLDAPPAQPAPVTDGDGDVPIVDAENVPIPDADRSRSPFGSAPDVSEMDLSGDLGRIIENDEEIAEALESMRRRESEFERTEAARTQLFMEQFSASHQQRLLRLEDEARETSRSATLALSENYNVRMRGLESELETHTASVIMAVRSNAEADQQRATLLFLEAMQRDFSSQVTALRDEHLSELTQLEQSMSAKAAAQLLSQREVSQNGLQRQQADARAEKDLYREESAKTIQSLRLDIFQRQQQHQLQYEQYDAQIGDLQQQFNQECELYEHIHHQYGEEHSLCDQLREQYQQLLEQADENAAEITAKAQNWMNETADHVHRQAWDEVEASRSEYQAISEELTTERSTVQQYSI